MPVLEVDQTDPDDIIDEVLKAINTPFLRFDEDIEPQDWPTDPVARLTEEKGETGRIAGIAPREQAERLGRPPRVKAGSETRAIEDISAVERAATQHGVEPQFKPKRWMRDYDNGRVPLNAMTPLGGGHYARPDVAKAFKGMKRAMRKDGLSLSITDSYRTYDAQVSLKGRKPSLAATPGKSNHGWGIAFDINVNDPKVYNWLKKNGKRFGFNQPMSYEPWHWEYEGGYKGAKGGGKARQPRRRPGRTVPLDPLNRLEGVEPLVAAPMVFGSVMGEVQRPPRTRREHEGNQKSGGLGFVPAKYRQMFRNAGNKYGVSPRLLAFVAKRESGFDPKVTSSAGAQGLMQVMPLHGLANPFNARANVNKGAQILAGYINKANGNLRLGLAYYNAGPNASQDVLQERMRVYSDPILDLFLGRGEAA